MFIAVPLRTQTILRENLRFPSGTATAKVIRTLHGLPEDDASFGRSRVAASSQHARRGAPELAAVGPSGISVSLDCPRTACYACHSCATRLAKHILGRLFCHIWVATCEAMHGDEVKR